MLAYTYYPFELPDIRGKDLEAWRADWGNITFMFNRKAFVATVEELANKWKVPIGIYAVEIDTLSQAEAFDVITKILAMGFEFGCVGTYKNGDMTFYEAGKKLWDKGKIEFPSTSS